MTRRIERLLSSLREAIHEALGESNGVASVMAELEREGHVPSFMVDVSLPEGVLTSQEIADLEADAERELPPFERELPSLEMVKRDGPLFLNESDEAFLHKLGVAAFQ